MEIVNIVAVATMKEKFDLDVLLDKLNYTEMASSWLKMRLKPENYYIAFYGSGKFLITGIKDLKTLSGVSKRVIKLLDNKGINNSLDKIEIKNIVMKDEIKLKKSLPELIVSLDTNASYEPEQFPGLFYKDSDGISYTLFSSGKMIITGFNDPKIAERNLKIFKKMLDF